MHPNDLNDKNNPDSPLALAMANAPAQPGVYLMKNAQGKVIYVGKAKNIRQRLRAYATLSDSRAMIPFLVANIAFLEFIVTNTEKEALILENNLIKMHHPVYNVFFRDDRTYYCLAVKLEHPFPAVVLTRAGLARKADKNFGPFPSSASAKKTLLFLQSVFLTRSCKDAEFARRQRPCVEYQIKRCSAPCVGKITASDYRRLVNDLSDFLDGGHKKLIAVLRQRMLATSDKLDFEAAALLRDQIVSLENATEKQSVTINSGKHIDIFGIFIKEGKTQACVMFIRTGKLLGTKNLPIIKTMFSSGTEAFGAKPSNAELSASELLASAELTSAIIKAYYGQSELIPDLIVIPTALDDAPAIAEWLSQKRASSVRIVVPKTGKLAALVKMAAKNAEAALESQSSKDARTQIALMALAKRLLLDKIPKYIECFDISNISGAHASGAKVAFVDGRVCHGMYRRYRIKTLGGADDYAMMREVLLRRFSKKDAPLPTKEERLPDLLIIDGGKGHLAVAKAALADCGLESIAIAALAKERGGELDMEPGAEHGGQRRVEHKPERVYLPALKRALTLPKGSPELLLLQEIRDEAHRFALRYHRHLRGKAMRTS